MKQTLKNNVSNYEAVNMFCSNTIFLVLAVINDVDLGNYLNTLRPKQNGRHFPADTFKCIFLNEKFDILINISMTFVPKSSINNIPALFQKGAL